MTSKIPSVLLTDFYKWSHFEQYAPNTSLVYSTLTPRSNKYFPEAKEAVVFGVQSFLKKLNEEFNENFFSKDKEEIINLYVKIQQQALSNPSPETSHIEALHDLGYLPIKVRALPEGTLAPIRVPIMTIENTLPEFFWVTNFLETYLSASTWQPVTSATLSYQYRKLLDKFALETTGSTDGVDFQAHDFSMRGMSSLESATTSGAAHLVSFRGTDTIPAIYHLMEYYNADIDNELIGGSIPATEHSVMCSYGETSEFDLFKRLITEIYPSGFFSVVSDTWDFWKVVTEYLPALKSEILARDGRVVIRPDSGDPVDILCGKHGDFPECERKGLIESLWGTFGGTANEQGYKVLDGHIGAIYGDSITLERARIICEKLKAKGFASTNVVFGVGSYSFQYNTRDTLGFAIKATYAVVDGEGRKLFKDPKTDDGTKKSQKGAVIIRKDDVTGLPYLEDNFDLLSDEYKEASKEDMMREIYLNGELLVDDTLAAIRERLNSYTK